MIALTVLCIISLCYLFFLSENLRNNGSKKIIYYATDIKKVGPTIIEYLTRDGKWHEKYPFVELGGGLAPVARYVGARLFFSQLVAVEWAHSLIWAGKFKNVLSNPKITYVRGLLEKHDFSKPAVYYCYLSEEILSTLYTQGAFKGSLIFALTFKIANLQPTDELILSTWQSPLRVYDFR